MRKSVWRKHHKWFGLCICFFLLMFSLSGIVLNHRQAVADLNVGRDLLPSRYHFSKWNGGLMRGTVSYVGSDSVRRVLIYGNGGIWFTDAFASGDDEIAEEAFADFNIGLPRGAEYHNIRSVVQTRRGFLFAVSPFGLYRYGMHGQWSEVKLPKDSDERLTDFAVHGDSLIVLGRSYLYVSTDPFHTFKKIELKVPEDYDARVTLFRTVWMLHSGELFGTVGKIVVDAVGIILIFLCITALLCWLLPKYLSRSNSEGEVRQQCARLAKFSFLWHDKIGRITIILTILVSITGWCLRPPMMIALVLNKIPAIPFTTLSSDSAWNDKLRMIRHDDRVGDWLLSTSEGFYSLKTLESIPEKIIQTPPVSVMGLNVLENDEKGNWICGSFSGIYLWDRKHQTSIDYLTKAPAPQKSGMPFGNTAVSGFSNDFACGPFVVEYYKGTDAIPQPAQLSTLPMSLWNFALEVHSGRIYFGSASTYFFVFIAGAIVLWCLWSGWKIRKRKKLRRH